MNKKPFKKMAHEKEETDLNNDLQIPVQHFQDGDIKQ